MIEVNCYDSSGNIVTEFYQWDLNQTITIRDVDTVDSAPELHFVNRNCEEALVVQSTLDNGVITCEIPNSILRDPHIIFIYGYKSVDEGKITTYGKTLFIAKLNVIGRLRPSDYVYEDDKQVISLRYIEDTVRKYAAQVTADKNSVQLMEANVEKMYKDMDTYATRITALENRVLILEEQINKLSGN